MTLKCLFPDRTTDTPRDFEFTGEWYARGDGVLMLSVKRQTGWQSMPCGDWVEARVTRGWWGNQVVKTTTRRGYATVPVYVFAWVPDHDFVDVYNCKEAS